MSMDSQPMMETASVAAFLLNGEGEEVQSRKIAALAVLVVLGFGLEQGARLLDGSTGVYSADPLSIPGVAIGGASCIAVALLSYYRDLNDILPIALLGIGCMLIRLLTIGIVGSIGILPILSQLFSGIGWMMMLACWMQVLSVNRPNLSAPMIIAGWLVALLIVPPFEQTSASDKLPIVAMLLAISVVVLVVCLAFNRDMAEYMKCSETYEIRETPIDEVMSRALFILALVTVASFACGFVLQGDISAGYDYMRSTLVSTLDAAVYAVLLVVFVALKPDRRALTVSFPVCLACLPIILAVKTLAPGCEHIGGALMVAFLMTLFGLFWIAFSRDAYERKLPAVFLLGIAVGSAQLSVALGRAAWLVIAQSGVGLVSIQTGFIALTIVATGSAVTIAVSTLREKKPHRIDALANDIDIADREISESDQEKDPNRLGKVGISPSRDDALDLLAETYDLSSREREVIVEYSMGRSARFIADQLLLSEYTIKSHLRRAYAKLGIHSRQELLDQIEIMEAKLHGMK